MKIEITHQVHDNIFPGVSILKACKNLSPHSEWIMEGTFIITYFAVTKTFFGLCTWKITQLMVVVHLELLKEISEYRNQKLLILYWRPLLILIYHSPEIDKLKSSN